MSLLDDVSIVVTPNGYKAGTLYSVLPTAIAGSELVQDSNFTLTGTQAQNTAGTYWVTYAGWTISGGKALRSGVSGNSPIAQNVPVVNGKVYKFSYTRTYASGNGETNLFVQTDGSNYVTLGSYTSTVVEEHTVTGTFVAGFTGNIFWQLYGIGTFTGTVDNVSVKEWSGADMNVTRATAGTRVDENGLVNYAEVLGSELVTDGGFPTGTTAWTVGGGWSIGNSVAEADGSTSTSNVLSQDLGLVATKNYIISFSSNRVGGTLFVKNGTSYQSTTIYTLNTGTGLEVQTFTLNLPSNSELGFYAFDYEGTIDNVTVKQTDRNNVPRIDYTGGGCPHILAEPERTNLIFYSNDFSNSSWTKVASGIDTSIGTDGINPNVEISPDGTQNADRVNFILQSNKDNGMYEIISASAGNSYTTSVYLKGEGVNIGKTIKVRIKRLSGGSFVTVDIDYVLTSEWFRLELNPLTLLSGNTNAILIFTSNDATNCLIYGCQVEEGSYATSYIPTSGSTVTRNADIFSRDGISSLINSTEGVLFAEINFGQIDSSARYICVSDGTTNNRAILGVEGGVSRIYYFFTNGGSGVVSLNNTLSDISIFNKVAIKWKENDFALWLNGVEVATDTSGTTPSAGTFNSLLFTSGASSQRFNGKVKQLQVYDTALTDNQLIQLTGEAGTHFFESYSEMAETLTYTIQ